MEHSLEEWKVMLETKSIDDKAFKQMFDQLNKKYDEICQQILHLNIKRNDILDVISLAKNKFKVNYAKQSNIEVAKEQEKQEQSNVVENIKTSDDVVKDTKDKTKRSKSKKVETQIEIQEEIQAVEDVQEVEEVQNEPVKEKPKRSKAKKV